MRRLFILGAGELGRELETWLGTIPKTQRDWEVFGYLHAGSSDLAKYPRDHEVVGDWQDFPFDESDICVMGVSNADWKQRISRSVSGRAQFMTFVAQGAIVSAHARLGEGSVICPNSVISTNAQLGKFVTINTGSQIGHDATIGDYSSLMASVNLGGNVRLGECVYAGTGAIVIPGRRIAAHTVIGAGSVLIHHVRTPATYFGNPARKLPQLREC